MMVLCICSGGALHCLVDDDGAVGYVIRYIYIQLCSAEYRFHFNQLYASKIHAKAEPNGGQNNFPYNQGKLLAFPNMTKVFFSKCSVCIYSYIENIPYQQCRTSAYSLLDIVQFYIIRNV